MRKKKQRGWGGKGQGRGRGRKGEGKGREGAEEGKGRKKGRGREKGRGSKRGRGRERGRGRGRGKGREKIPVPAQEWRLWENVELSCSVFIVHFCRLSGCLEGSHEMRRGCLPLFRLQKEKEREEEDVVKAILLWRLGWPQQHVTQPGAKIERWPAEGWPKNCQQRRPFLGCFMV